MSDQLVNLQAERELLGSMMLYSPTVIDPVMGVLRRDDFMGPRHGEIYEAICDILREGKPIGTVVLMQHLKERYGWQSSDAHDLMEAVTEAGFQALVPGYVETISSLSDRRALLHESSSLAAAAETGSAEERARRAARALELTEPRISHERTRRLGEVMLERPEDFIGKWDSPRELHGISSGIPGLDRFTMGWRDGNLVVIAARPAVGKTALAVHCAISALKRGHGVFFVSMEMSEGEIHERISAHLANLDSRMLSLGDLRDGHLDRAASSQAELAGLEVFVNTRLRNPLEIHEEVASHGRKIGLVIIDYIGLMQPVGHFGSREQEVAWLSRECKKMAAELNRPVLLLSQLSRALKGNESKRPILSDLRDSGAIESDANVVIFLHDAGVLSGNAGELEHVELIVAKQRNGPTGVVDVRYRRDTGRFTQWP